MKLYSKSKLQSMKHVLLIFTALFIAFTPSSREKKSTKPTHPNTSITGWIAGWNTQENGKTTNQTATESFDAFIRMDPIASNLKALGATAYQTKTPRIDSETTKPPANKR